MTTTTTIMITTAVAGSVEPWRAPPDEFEWFAEGRTMICFAADALPNINLINTKRIQLTANCEI